MCQLRQAIVVTGAGTGSGSAQSATMVPSLAGRIVQQFAVGSHLYSSSEMPSSRSSSGFHALSRPSRMIVDRQGVAHGRPGSSAGQQPVQAARGSGGAAVRATEAVPVLVGQQQRAAVGRAGGDQHHVVPLDVEVALQVVINVPSDRWQLAGPEHIGEVPNGQIVGLFVVQSS